MDEQKDLEQQEGQEMPAAPTTDAPAEGDAPAAPAADAPAEEADPAADENANSEQAM